MKITGDWILAKPTQAVCQMLEIAGYQALFVGGCVRNALLGAPVADIDIATDATPEKVVQLAEHAGLKPVPTGIDHGTITVVSDGLPHEVTTFREDVETFGRHATVAFSTDVAQDARRRDFTMNALYARSDGSVIDPLGGLDDLKARRVRFIENPDQRIREDYLRILRFFRFHAWYGDPDAGLDPEGIGAIATHLDGLSGLSKERVGAEIVKLLSAADPAPAVAAMRATGVLNMVLPGADDRALAPLVHLERMISAAPDGMRRLAALGGDHLQERLRLSKSQARRADLLRTEAADMRGPAELGYRFGKADACDILLLRAALLEQPWDNSDLGQIRDGAAATFPLKAGDLMPRYQGPELGRRLKALEKRWIESGFRLTRDDLLAE
ncbi:CCA tRNA nucleotidyltransferase [Roseovarius sp. MMSF_3281]|uniref:CCA tRNA nucleotidyltransferase n=1 Tax=Roseovarius sp. MMSF_3281 TaxID=3046694 RepID=UPI0027401C3E|nr:CCA tRNA nucleotidyltransferase [Roseovarius sp. MMSF_3281]